MTRINPILWVALVAAVVGGGLFWGATVLMGHIITKLVPGVENFVEDVYVEPPHPSVIQPWTLDPAYRAAEHPYAG